MSTIIQLNDDHKHFLNRIHIHQWLYPAIILHYDQTSRDLRPWFWYVPWTY